jgi:transposase-like protein
MNIAGLVWVRRDRMCWVMDERMQFVARRLAGEAMSELCREFGISRKTGYKIFERYQECGVQGLTDRRPQEGATITRRSPSNFSRRSPQSSD